MNATDIIISILLLPFLLIGLFFFVVIVIKFWFVAIIFVLKTCWHLIVVNHP